MNSFRRLIYALGLLYFRLSPIDRGKWRLLQCLSRCLGPARYKRQGLTLWLDPASLPQREIIQNSENNPVLWALICERSWAGDYFVDIGANFGYFSLLAASRGAKTIAFEPSPRELQRFWLNLAASGVSNVSVFPIALSDHEHEPTLWVGDVGNTGSNALTSCAAEGTIRVTALPLAEVITAGIMRKVRLVKIDVEGHEMRVLKGLEAAIPFLGRADFVVEITPTYLKRSGDSADEIYNFFGQHGFQPRFGRKDTFQWDEVFSRQSFALPRSHS